MVKHSQHSHIHCHSATLPVSTVHLCYHIGNGGDSSCRPVSPGPLNPSRPTEFAGRPIELFQLTLGLVPAQFLSTVDLWTFSFVSGFVRFHNESQSFGRIVVANLWEC